MAFLEFLKRLYDMESEYLGPEGAGAGPGMADADSGGDIGSILGLLAGGANATRSDRPMAPGMRPDAGDLVDSNNEMGGSPLQGLFGQAPVPLRQPAPGISQRRPGQP